MDPTTARFMPARAVHKSADSVTDTRKICVRAAVVQHLRRAISRDEANALEHFGRATPAKEAVVDFTRADLGVLGRTLDSELAPNCIERTLQPLVPWNVEEPRSPPRDPASIGDVRARPKGRVGHSAKLQPSDGGDEPHTPVSALGVAEREQSRLAHEVSAIPEDDVPEIVRVSKPVPHPGEFRICDGLCHQRCLHQSVCSDAFGFYEVEIRAPEAPLWKLGQTPTIAKHREKVGASAKESTPRFALLKSCVGTRQRRALQRLDDLEDLLCVVGIRENRPNSLSGPEGPNAGHALQHASCIAQTEGLATVRLGLMARPRRIRISRRWWFRSQGR